jgi:3-hydroxyisobutyrate dehydrogenase-like beta-hydroxyacid dehydrogenase
MIIGLVGAGAMGGALGAAWRSAGHEVRTDLSGRSARTVALARDHGITPADGLHDVIGADLVVSIVPPAAAIPVARDIVRAATEAGAAPLVADLNAVSPRTVAAVAGLLRDGGLELVDGTVSGTPPRPGGRTTPYLSGERAGELRALSNTWHRTVILEGGVGAASALKMATSSMYKGTNALVLQAALTASHFGVLDAFLQDVSGTWPDNVPRWPWEVALAASKSERFVDEMREIAVTQAQAGLVEDLFLGVAAVFERLSHTDLARATPEAVPREIDFTQIADRFG